MQVAAVPKPSADLRLSGQPIWIIDIDGFLVAGSLDTSRCAQ
jgi:hypothetical protein